MTSIIELAEVTKRYFDGSQRVVAVDSVSLELQESVLAVIQGPSGSGKTTLLGLAGGLITPTSGEVKIAGESVVHMRDHHRTRWRREHVGFVFQDLALIPRMTLLENVLLPLAPMGGASKDARKRAAELLERFGLSDKMQTATQRLSGGERQRGSLARALITGAKLLLLDEPTAHVDADNVDTMIAMLAQLRDEGRTIIASTHDPRLAEHAAVDRVVEISAGRLRADYS